GWAAVDPYLERVVVVRRLRDPVAQHSQLADDRHAVEPGLLVQLPAQRLFRRLARVGAPGGNLRAGLGIALLLEDQQLRAPGSLRGAVPHPPRCPARQGESLPNRRRLWPWRHVRAAGRAIPRRRNSAPPAEARSSPRPSSRSRSG